MTTTTRAKAYPMGLRGTKQTPEYVKAVELVQSWTRERFALPVEAPILVSQLTCSNENCPPLQTMIAFWTEGGERHHFKVLKPIEAIAKADIPTEWLDDGLFSGGGSGGAACC